MTAELAPGLPRHIVEEVVARALEEDLGAAGDVTTTATPPLDTRQQSRSRNGSAIHRELWWSEMVIGSRICACGLSAAQSRCDTATAAK